MRARSLLGPHIIAANVEPVRDELQSISQSELACVAVINQNSSTNDVAAEQSVNLLGRKIALSDRDRFDEPGHHIGSVWYQDHHVVLILSLRDLPGRRRVNKYLPAR